MPIRFAIARIVSPSAMHCPNSAKRSFMCSPDKGVSLAFENVLRHMPHA